MSERLDSASRFRATGKVCPVCLTCTLILSVEEFPTHTAAFYACPGCQARTRAIGRDEKAPF